MFQVGIVMDFPLNGKLKNRYKKNKKNKDEVPIKDFRKECRDFAKNGLIYILKNLKDLV